MGGGGVFPCSLGALVLFSVIFIVAWFPSPIDAVDRGNFKTCDQAHFCKRQRRIAEQSEKPVYKVTDQLRVERSRATATLSGPDNSVLQLQLVSYRDGIARVTVTEADSHVPRRQKVRYSPRETLVAHIDSLEVPFVPRTSAHADQVDLLLSDEKSLLRVHTNPLAMELLDISTNPPTSVITVNSRQLLNIEAFREKRDSDEPESWEESFKSHTDSKPHGPEAVAADFTFPHAAQLFGLPEHSARFALPATRDGVRILTDPYRLYNLDVFEYETENGMALYGSVPLVLSHTAQRSAAVFWFNSAETWIDVQYVHEGLLGFGSSARAETHFISESGALQFFLFQSESPHTLFEKYAALTGPGHLPPLFAVAYHQCRWNYRDEADVLDVDANFDVHGMPMDVIWLDIEHTDAKKYFTWDARLFPHPEQMQSALAAKGRQMVTIVDPHIKRDGSYRIHTEAQAKGYYVKTRDGKDYDGHCWPGSVSYPDFTEPHVRDWWADKFAFSEYRGSTSSLYTWNDMNEPSVFSGPETTAPKDLMHADNFEHRDVHNLYGMHYHMSTFEGHLRRNGSARNDRPFVLTRAFFAGVQRYGAVWTGDNRGEWSHLRIATPMLLSLSVAGVPFVGADVGGFFGNPTPELLTRWAQAAAFTPFFRGHAHIDTKRREPYLFGEPHTSRLRAALRSRYQLLPYIYTLFAENNRTGVPVMRPMWVEFPTDTEFFAEDDEFMLGGALLVAPVYEDAQETKHIRLPGKALRERWYSYHTLAAVDSFDFTAPLTMERIPVYLRGGHILPRKDRPRRSSAAMRNDPLTLYVALNSSGSASGRLYIDDGRSYAYRTAGQYVDTELSFAANRLSCRPRHAQYPAPELVERVVVAGLRAAPARVQMRAGSTAATPLEFAWDAATSVLTIRKPDVRIAEPFVIDLIG